jgi:hypothetical protein
MLDTFNKSWREGVCPQSWRDAVIVPILKPDKPQGQLNSYRPIALTSCLAKVMERMVAKIDRYIFSNRQQSLCIPWICKIWICKKK